jgi:hypothetical protein
MRFRRAAYSPLQASSSTMVAENVAFGLIRSAERVEVQSV